MQGIRHILIMVCAVIFLGFTTQTATADALGLGKMAKAEWASTENVGRQALIRANADRAYAAHFAQTAEFDQIWEAIGACEMAVFHSNEEELGGCAAIRSALLDAPQRDDDPPTDKEFWGL